MPKPTMTVVTDDAGNRQLNN